MNIVCSNVLLSIKGSKQLQAVMAMLLKINFSAMVFLNIKFIEDPKLNSTMGYNEIKSHARSF